jgi:hypothetical protein
MLKVIIIVFIISLFISALFVRWRPRNKQLGHIFFIITIIGNVSLLILFTINYNNYIDLLNFVIFFGLYNLTTLTYISFHSGVEAMSPSMLLLSKVLSQPGINYSDIKSLRLEEIALNDRLSRLRSSRFIYNSNSEPKINFLVKFFLHLMFHLFPIREKH